MSDSKSDLYSIAQERFETEICNNMELIEDRNKDILKLIERIITQNQNQEIKEITELNDFKGKKKI